MNTLVVYAHPVPESFCAALLDRVVHRIRADGHDLRLRDLYAEGFGARLEADEHAGYLDDPTTKPQLQSHFDDVRWARRLILVYPTWWGAHPAILKGWFERVFVRGVAWEVAEGGTRHVPLLTNIRSVVAVTTHGSSKLVNSLQGEAGKRTVKRGLGSFLHRKARIRWVAFYGVDRDEPEKRAAFVDRVGRVVRAR